MTVRYLRSHAIDLPVAEKYQLGFVNPAENADEPFRGRLAIPYITPGGIKGFKFRCTRDHDCKAIGCTRYLYPEGQTHRIFNPAAFFNATDTIGVTEGEINAIVATEFVGIPTVGIPGTDAWKPNRNAWRRTFEDYDIVLIFTDEKDDASPRHPDGAGMDLARAISHDVGHRGRMVRCDTGYDVASMVANGKADTLRERAGLRERESLD